MAVTYMYGFEGASGAVDNVGIVSSAYSTAQARTGTYSIRCNPGSGSSQHVGITGGDGWWHFGLYVATLPSVDRAIFSSYFSGTQGLRLDLTSGGAIKVYADGTLRGTSSSTAFASPGWHWIGIRTTVTDTDLLQIDGKTEVSGAGVATSGVPRIGAFNGEASSIDIYIDDVIVDNAEFLPPSKVTNLVPISDNANTGWVRGGGTTNTSLYIPVSTAPPPGVASANETDSTNIECASNTTNNYTANLTTYSTAGIKASDTVLAVHPVIRHGEDIATNTKAGTIEIVANPAIGTTSFNFGNDAGAHAAETSSPLWYTTFGTLTTSPSVTLSSSPTMRVIKTTASTRVACVDYMGMIVAWTPLPYMQKAQANASIKSTSRAYAQAQVYIPPKRAFALAGAQIKQTYPLHPIIAYDLFTAPGAWGTVLGGTWNAYDISGTGSIDYSVNGSISNTQTSSSVQASMALSDVTAVDSIVTATFTPPSLLGPGTSSNVGLLLRGRNQYATSYSFDLNGNLTVVAIKEWDGTSWAVAPILATVSNPILNGGGAYKCRAQIIGSEIKTKIWAASESEPAGWVLETSDSTHTSAGVTGVWAQINAGSDSGGGVAFSSFIAYATTIGPTYAQAQAQITAGGGATTYKSYAQAQAHTKVFASNSYAQSQAQIKQTYPFGTSYTSTILADSPFAYWPLDETAGTTANDIIGTNDGTYSGGYTLSETPLISTGTSVYFDGTNGKVTAAGDTIDYSDNTFSIEVWLKTNSPTGTGCVFSQSGNSGSQPFIKIDSNGTLRMGDNGVQNIAVSSAGRITSGSTYHVVWTKNGTTNTIYINGTDDTSNFTITNGTFGAPGSGDIVIGVNPNGSSEYFKGWIDEVAVYSIVLSGSQITAHYAARTGGGVFGPTFAQAQTTIITTKQSYAQSQGTIKATSLVYAQAQTQIYAATTTVNVYAQSQGQIKTTYLSCAQAQSQIKATYQSYAQAHSWIKQTYPLAGSITIAQDSFTEGGTGTTAITNHTAEIGGTWSNWLNTGFVINRDIDQAQTSTTTNYYYATLPSVSLDNGSVYIVYDETYSGSNVGGVMARVNGTNNSYIAWVVKDVTFLTVERITSGSRTQLSQVNLGVMDSCNIRLFVEGSTPTTIKAKKWAVGSQEPISWAIETSDNTSNNQISSGPIGLIGRGVSGSTPSLDNLLATQDAIIGPTFAQAQANIIGTSKSYAQSQAQIKITYSVCAQSNTYIKTTGLQIFAQGQAQIKATYQVYAQANSKIILLRQVNAQAQAQIKQTYQVYAQAQSITRLTSIAYAQAQAIIKQTYQGYSQAQAVLRAQGNGYANAQVNIYIPTYLVPIADIATNGWVGVVI